MLNKLIVAYDAKRFPFAEIVASALGVEDLRLLHAGHRTEDDRPGFGNQATELHRRLYALGGGFDAAYRDFMELVVAPMIGESIRYQSVPNWRVQMPGRTAVGVYHRDRQGGHSDSEITFWVPLTSTTAENTIWVESADGRGDYRAAIVPYGKMFVFDSANLQHGNRPNGSSWSRVSFDFRVVPESLFSSQQTTPHHTGVDAPIQWLPAGAAAPKHGDPRFEPRAAEH